MIFIQIWLVLLWLLAALALVVGGVNQKNTYVGAGEVVLGFSMVVLLAIKVFS